MNLKKALSILELEKIPTEEELKKQYRKLIKKCHPDRHSKESTEEQERITTKSQDLNNAHEFLKKYIKTMNVELSESGYDEISILFKKNNREKQAYINILNTYYTKCEDEALMSNVKELIKECGKRINGNNLNNQQVIIYFKERLKQIYINFIKLYIKLNHFPKFIIKKYNFNYDCDCANIYSQLQQCIKIIDTDIYKIIEPIKQKEHYKILKDQINEILKELKFGLTNIEISKDEYQELLHIYKKKIESIYEEYERKYYRFILIISKTADEEEKKTHKIYKNAKKIVLETSENEIKKLFNKMYSHQEKKHKDKELLYKRINELYLQHADGKNSLQVNELYLLASKLILSNNCPPEIKIIIGELSFENPQQELNELKRYEKIFLKEETLKEILYINKINPQDINLAKKISILSNDMNFYELKQDSNKKIIYPELMFNSIYTTIEKFLYQSTFIGLSTLNNDYQIKLLYFNLETGKILGINEYNEFEIFDDSIQKEYDFYQDDKLRIYQNKEYLEYKMFESTKSKNNLDDTHYTSKQR